MNKGIFWIFSSFLSLLFVTQLLVLAEEGDFCLQNCELRQAIADVDDDDDGSTRFGARNSLTGDGIHAAIGDIRFNPESGPDDDIDGEVYFYDFDCETGLWSRIQRFQPSIPPGNLEFGAGLSMWENCTLVGATRRDSPSTSRQGGVCSLQFNETLGLWEDVQTIFPMVLSDDALFGFDIEIYKTWAITSASGFDFDEDFRGEVYFLQRNESDCIWTERQSFNTTRFTGAVNLTVTDLHRSVAIDRNLAAVQIKGFVNDNVFGDVYESVLIFHFNNDTNEWLPICEVDHGDNDDNDDDLFGHDIDIVSPYVFIGAPEDGEGKVYSFFVDLATNNCTLEQVIDSVPDDDDEGGFGSSLDGARLNENGLLYLYIGNPTVRNPSITNTQEGRAYLYKREENGVWTGPLKTFLPDLVGIFDHFGIEIDIVKEGDTVLMGMFEDTIFPNPPPDTTFVFSFDDAPSLENSTGGCPTFRRPCCGDHIIQSNEVCDDGNKLDGDYCSSDCQNITGVCGDGVKQNNEACDDGNLIDGDYCSSDCQTVTGFCGDNTVQTNEACDDGNTIDGDYCSSDCQTITGFCGDGMIQNNEDCDTPFGLCCDSSTCLFKSSSVVCRPIEGLCDIPENCTGSTGQCPPDLVKPADTPCPLGDPHCTFAKCNGTSPLCERDFCFIPCGTDAFKTGWKVFPLPMPIPADFFFPGSDPFVGPISLAGAPLTTSEPGITLFTDTIIERIEDAQLPGPGQCDTIPVEIVALHLKSVVPIMVTGAGPPLWDVEVFLSFSVQPTGQATICASDCGCEEGGHFDVEIPVLPKLVFTPVNMTMPERVLDFGMEGFDPDFVNLTNVWWHPTDPGFDIVKLTIPDPDEIFVDFDGMGGEEPVPLKKFPGCFYPSVCFFHCDGTCNDPGTVVHKRVMPGTTMFPSELNCDDFDGDLIADDADNCPNITNPHQEDADSDGIGDVCDLTPNIFDPCEDITEQGTYFFLFLSLSLSPSKGIRVFF